VTGASASEMLEFSEAKGMIAQRNADNSMYFSNREIAGERRPAMRLCW
jgi:hypothetical protein